MNTEEKQAETETRDLDEFDPFRPADTKSGGSGVGWLALLMVLGLAGWNGWQWWQAQQSEQLADEAVDARIADLSLQVERDRRRLDELATAQGDAAGLAERLARLESSVASSGTQDDTLRRELDAVAAQVLGLGRSLEENQAALAALAVRDESPGRRVELSEIAFLLRAANERLVLFGDRAGADRALALADAQLVALDEPLYLSVRQSIASARLALEQAPVIDTVALTQRLDQLQLRVPALALEGEAAPATSAQASVEGEAEPSLWARFKATLSGLVTVRQRADDEALFSLDDRDTLRQGLWLQLESARLALLRGDEDAWATSLARADSALQKWFDADDAAVRQSRDDIAQLAGVSLAMELPDISAPWAMFNRLRAAPEPTRSRPSTDAATAAPETAIEEAAAPLETEPEPLPPAGEVTGGEGG